MLLRRVIEHMKSQNWTAAAFDFVIVVVGVSIGIPVSNWNARKRVHALRGGPCDGCAGPRNARPALP